MSEREVGKCSCGKEMDAFCPVHGLNAAANVALFDHMQKTYGKTASIEDMEEAAFHFYAGYAAASAHQPAPVAEPSQPNDAGRKEFEEWLAEFDSAPEEGDYNADDLWAAWQAARSSPATAAPDGWRSIESLLRDCRDSCYETSQNDEMIDQHYTKRGRALNEIAEAIDRLLAAAPPAHDGETK